MSRMSFDWTNVFGDASSGISSSQNRKRKHANAVAKPSQSDPSSWIDRYSPKTFEELAVHKKKVAEVESWISRSKLVKGAPILLLTGPSGCGKTATLLVTASAHSIEVQEWTNPLSVSFDATREAGLQHQSLTSQFEEFLFRSGRYPTLVISGASSRQAEENNNLRKILLLEDLPHHIIREPTSFRDTLRQYTRHQKHPLVMIISDRSIPDSTKRNLLPQDVLTQLNVHTINFNPIATTSMTKALSRVISKENQRLSKEHLSQVVSSASGDIRAAINSLQFILQKGAPLTVFPPVPKKSKSSLKRRKSVDLIKADAVPLVGGKDVSLLLFRALGKILYCKREELDSIVPSFPSNLKHLHRDPLVFEPEEILDHCCLSGPSYSLFLHHNCVPFFSKVDDLSSTLNYFCYADLIGTRRSGVDFSTDSTMALEAYEGSITARGVAFCNSDRATAKQCESASGQWRPLHKPSWYQVSRKRAENQTSSHNLFWNYNLPSAELLLNLLPFVQKLATRNSGGFSSRTSHVELNLNPAQREFLHNIVNLPKWKAFSSGKLERITEADVEDADVNDVEMGDVPCSGADGECVESQEKDPDEDFNIEDFDD